MSKVTRGPTVAEKEQKRRAGLAATTAVGGGALMASIALPWVTYRSNSSAHASHLHPSAFGIVLVAIAAASIVIGVMRLLAGRRVLAVGLVGLGAAGFICTGIAAAARMSHANSLTLNGGSTSYAIGIAVAFAGAAVLIAAGAADLGQPKGR